MIDRLEEKELEEVAELISGTVIPEIVRIADTYSYDRDSLIKYVADMFSTMAEIATFEHWQTEKERQGMNDAISRDAVLDLIADYDLSMGQVVKGIHALPSVNLRGSKTGHWEQYGDYWEDRFKCSECGKEQPKILNGEKIIGHWSDYCPNCGARMESEG